MFLKTCKQIDQVVPTLVSLANRLMPIMAFSLVMQNERGIIYFEERNRGALSDRQMALVLDALFSTFVSVLSKVSSVAMTVESISFCHRISQTGLKKYLSDFCCTVAPGGTVNSLHFRIKSESADFQATSTFEAQIKDRMLKK